MYAALDVELGVRLYQYLKPHFDQANVDSNTSIPELVSSLAELYEERIALHRSMNDRLCVLQLKENLIRNAIEDKLKNGAESYEDELGSCSYKMSERREVDAILVRTHFPQFADTVIYEKVNRDRLEELLIQSGFDESELERVMRVVGKKESVNIRIN